MGLRMAEEYVQKLATMRPNVYVGGQKISRDSEILEKAINTIRFTFDTAQTPQFQHLTLTTSHLTGEQINRFTNVHRSVEDLLKKQEMTRVLCQRVGGCIQRCMATDTLNAMGVVSKEIDEKKGTEYHRNFLKFLEYYQKNDLVGNAAQTDAKGDRSKRPHQQADPDLYLRVVEKKSDGIVVRGAKAHNTIAPYADELLVVPTRNLTKEEGDWAVSFALPADWEGVKLICRVTSPRQRIKYQAPYNRYGVADSLTVFDNVFIPWERVFMCGEWEYGARLALLFANYHRHTYCGCKPAVTDVIMGATALVADYNGVGEASHIRDEITELMIIAELVYAAGIAASVKGKPTSSGIYEPNFLYSNAGRYLAGKNIMHEYEILASTAGGWAATMPHEEEWINPDTKPFLEKYAMRKPGIPAEWQHRLFRFISDFSCSAAAGVWQYAGIHGGGSPVMEKIGIRQQYDLESKKGLVKYLSGIEERG